MFSIIFLLLSVSFVAVSDVEDGWVTLYKERKKERFTELEDPAVWPIFYKDLGVEKFSVALPSHPVYSHMCPERFELRSEKNEDFVELSVVPKKGSDQALAGDSICQVEGGWVFEYVILTEHYKYVLRTYALDSESSFHAKFIHSFSVY